MSQEVGALHAKLGLDDSGFQAGLRTAEAGLRQAGIRLPNLATGIAVGVGAAIAIVGSKAIGAARDFESSMAKIVGLVGVSREQVNAWADDIANLAPRVGRSPQELGDALFFIASAGVEGSAAMQVLERSAMAAAVGLGETKTIADLVTSAVNAYGTDVLSASRATDDLTMAVRLGKLEPDQLAGAMGRVLPLASAMGVEFHEVAAGFAAMSRTGTNASEASTQLRGILSQLLSPSEQAKRALADIGMSVEGVQASLREDGLLATLELLVEGLGGNVTAAEAVFGNIRALSGVMDMLGSNVDGTRAIFDEMTSTTGVLDDAFANVSETAEFKMSQATAALSTKLLEMGSTILPAFVGALEGVMPVLMLLADTLGIVFSAIRAVSDAIRWMVDDTAVMSNAMTKIGEAVDAGLVDPLEVAEEAMLRLAMAGEFTADNFEALQEATGLTVSELRPMLQAILDTSDAFGSADSAQHRYIEGLLEANRLAAPTVDGWQRVAQAHGDAAEATDEHTRAHRNLIDELKAAADPVFAAVRAQERLERQQAATASVLADATATVQEKARAELELAMAVLEAEGAFRALEQAPAGVVGGLDAIGEATGRTRGQVLELLEQLGILDGLQVTSHIAVSAPTVRYTEERGGMGLVPSVVDRRLLRHAGGIVPGIPGQVVPLLALAGERVVPGTHHSDDGGQVNMRFEGRVILDGHEVGEVVMDRAVREYRHRTGDRN